MAEDDAPRGSRRRFLSRATTLAVASVTAGAAGGTIRFLLPNAGDGSDLPRMVGPLADFRRGTIAELDREGVFVVHAEDGLAAISTECTHLGCRVRHTSSGFACPCHGARFDALGRVRSGPARRALTWHPVEVDESGRLWVDLGRTLPAGTFTRPGGGSG